MFSHSFALQWCVQICETGCLGIPLKQSSNLVPRAKCCSTEKQVDAHTVVKYETETAQDKAPPNQFHNKAHAQDLITQKVFGNSRLGNPANAFQSFKYKSRLVRPFEHLKTMPYMVWHLPTIANFTIFTFLFQSAIPAGQDV